MNTSFLSDKEIDRIGFKAVGKNAMISRKASIYSPENIEIGDNTRIDDFCILSGKIFIGRNIHIAPYSGLFGGIKGIRVDDFANISSRVCIYALSDNFVGESLTNPTIPDEFKKVEYSPVIIEKHVIIGTGSTILPGVILKEGTAVGSMSLVKNSTEAWGIYAGVPAKLVKHRESKIIKELEIKYWQSLERLA